MEFRAYDAPASVRAQITTDQCTDLLRVGAVLATRILKQADGAAHSRTIENRMARAKKEKARCFRIVMSLRTLISSSY